MSIDAETIAKRAKHAFDLAQTQLSTGPAGHADSVRSSALHQIAIHLERAKDEIQTANQEDMRLAQEQVAAGKLSASLASRLDLFSKKGKWESMIAGVRDVAALPSPLDACTYAKRLAEPTPTSGALDLYRVTCPIGVLLCIFEARPEVIVNIASLAIKSGNAAILKGGKESKHTSAVMARIISLALTASQLPADLVQTVETRQDVAALLHQDKYVDLVVPRGSNELVRSIQREARMPVMGHADGLCIGYVHQDAQLDLAIGTILDAKTDYPAACNALETLLVHRSHLATPFWPTLASALTDAGVTLHCDSESIAPLPSSSHVVPATEQDFDTEFLDLHLAVKAVSDLDQAIAHINTHSSHHTDILLTAPLAPGSSNPTADKFTRSLSSANIFVNASSRFADGFRFGFGTEVGISTGRTHARGPVGLEGLVIYKYIVRGQGHGPQTAADFSRERKWAHTDLDKTYPHF